MEKSGQILSFILLWFMLKHEVPFSIHNLPIHNLIEQGAGPARATPVDGYCQPPTFQSVSLRCYSRALHMHTVPHTRLGIPVSSVYTECSPLPRTLWPCMWLLPTPFRSLSKRDRSETCLRIAYEIPWPPHHPSPPLVSLPAIFLALLFKWGSCLHVPADATHNNGRVFVQHYSSGTWISFWHSVAACREKCSGLLSWGGIWEGSSKGSW